MKKTWWLNFSNSFLFTWVVYLWSELHVQITYAVCQLPTQFLILLFCGTKPIWNNASSSRDPEENRADQRCNKLPQYHCGYLNRGQSLVGQTNACIKREGEIINTGYLRGFQANPKFCQSLQIFFKLMLNGARLTTVKAHRYTYSRKIYNVWEEF